MNTTNILSKSTLSRISYTNSSQFIITYSEWCEILNVKKYNNLKQIETITILDDTSENVRFISLIKKLLNINIFDLSRISYLALLFFSPYIDVHLDNLIKSDRTLSLAINYDVINPEYDHDKYDFMPPLDNTITCILAHLLDLIIQIELYLNIHLLIIYSHIHNLASSTASNTTNNTTSNTNDININKNKNDNNNISKSKCLHKLDSIIIQMNYGIKKSTHMLLLLKILNKLFNYNINYNTKLNDSLTKDISKEKIDRLHQNIKINNDNLDNFITAIFDLDVVEHFNSADVIWSTSKDYIMKIIRTNLEHLETFINILLKYLILENHEEESKLISIKNSVINFISMEIDLIESKL